MAITTVYATQGGGISIYDELQQAQVWYELPNWGNFKIGDPIPSEWDYQRCGMVSHGPVEEMETTERGGYEAGFANKSDPNPFFRDSVNNRHWQLGHDRGTKERLALDAEPVDPNEINFDANVCVSFA